MVSIKDLPKEILVNILDSEPKLEIENIEIYQIKNINPGIQTYIQIIILIKYINIKIFSTVRIPINDKKFIENLEKFIKNLLSNISCGIVSSGLGELEDELYVLDIAFLPDKFIVIGKSNFLPLIFRRPLINFVKKISLMVSGQNIDSEIKLLYNKLELMVKSDPSIKFNYIPNFFPLKSYPFELLKDTEIEKYFKILNNNKEGPLIFPLLHIDYNNFVCWSDYSPICYTNLDLKFL